MASSKLLKEAIADAKAVRETAIANAKIALEEAFTPRLQSILSRKLQAEMEGEEDEVVEDIDSSEIGTGDNMEPAEVADETSTDLGVETEEETAEVGEEDANLDVVDDLTELDANEDGIEDDVTGATYDVTEGEEFEVEDEVEVEDEIEDEDELDLEAIIRELEGELDSEEEVHEEDEYSEEPVAEESEEEFHTEESEEEMYEEESEEEVHEEEDFSDEIDLDEILREMGYGDDEEEVTEEEEVEMDAEKMAEMEAELEEAYNVIKSLKKTINEVNLLNAKLLYANKLFRSYNLNNEQKVKVVENLDRTGSVREVKLVFATLAESMKFTGTEKKVSAKKTMTEGLASKAVASTAPKKEIIAESTNELANRFKELAGIIQK
jgi:hypothetical protein